MEEKKSESNFPLFTFPRAAAAVAANQQKYQQRSSARANAPSASFVKIIT